MTRIFLSARSASSAVHVLKFDSPTHTRLIPNALWIPLARVQAQGQISEDRQDHPSATCQYELSMMTANKQLGTNSNKGQKIPALKSASGAGFTFEDKVAALLLCEMLSGKLSLGADWGIIDRIERQAGDWEPFGDLLLTVQNADGKPVKCGCSVKSNRQITVNGCDAEMCDSLWNVIAKPEADPIL